MHSFVIGFFPTGFALLVSYALAKWGFENIYYLAQLLPICMVFYLVLAWFIYLKKSSAFGWNRHLERLSTGVVGHHQGSAKGGLSEDKITGKELRYLRDEKGPIFRKEGPSLKPHEPSHESQNSSSAQAIAILLWSACQLGVIAAFLYHCFGIGARYY